MKYFTLLGGFLGWSLTFLSSLCAGAETALALRDAMIGCLVGAALLRGFRHTILCHVRSLALSKNRDRGAGNSAA